LANSINQLKLETTTLLQGILVVATLTHIMKDLPRIGEASQSQKRPDCSILQARIHDGSFTTALKD
jgi:hypothetical protein